MKSKILVYGALCVAALLLTVCNGGGSDVAPNYNALLSGNYQVNQVGDAGASAVAVTETLRADVTADGNGAGTMNIVAHSAGVTGSGAYSYAVASDRTFSITTSVGTMVHGIVSASGNAFVLSDTSRTVSTAPPEDAAIVMVAGIKKASGLSNAVLNGSYQIHQAGDAGAGAGMYTARVDITANGAGTGTWNIASHSAGDMGSGVFNYIVSAADGTFSVTTEVPGPVTIGTDHGIISADGSMFVITDTVPLASGGPPVEDGEITMAVGLKKSTGLTNAVLSGNYQINQVGKGAAGMYTARVNISADGAGAGTWSIASHSAGDTGSGVFSYAVAADGTFSVTTAAGIDHGIVSADGSLFVLSDTNPTPSAVPPVEDAEIIMAVGIRK